MGEPRGKLVDPPPGLSLYFRPGRSKKPPVREKAASSISTMLIHKEQV